MARRNNKQQKGQNGAGSPNHPDYNYEQQMTTCQTCGKYHRGICRFANGNQGPRNNLNNQQSNPCNVCGQRHRGPCRLLADFDKLNMQNQNQNQSSNRTRPNKAWCPECRRRHTGPCRNIIRGRLQSDGRNVLLPLRAVAARVRRHGEPERVDYFIREVGSEDALMCYCDGTESSFCVKHFAEQAVQQ